MRCEGEVGVSVGGGRSVEGVFGKLGVLEKGGGVGVGREGRERG